MDKELFSLLGFSWRIRSIILIKTNEPLVRVSECQVVPVGGGFRLGLAEDDPGHRRIELNNSVTP